MDETLSFREALEVVWVKILDWLALGFREKQPECLKFGEDLKKEALKEKILLICLLFRLSSIYPLF